MRFSITSLKQESSFSKEGHNVGESNWHILALNVYTSMLREVLHCMRSA